MFRLQKYPISAFGTLVRFLKENDTPPNTQSNLSNKIFDYCTFIKSQIKLTSTYITKQADLPSTKPTLQEAVLQFLLNHP